MITIFANFRINDHERLQRMKNSFLSFYNLEAEWVINIRGKFKYEAKEYLSKYINEKCYISHYETKNGWIEDTIYLHKFINTEYILVWVEDHICQINTEKLNLIINEMKSNSIDYLNYTWYFSNDLKIWYNNIDKLESNNLFHFTLDTKNYKRISKSSRGYNYLISLPSIFSNDLFLKNLNCNRPFFRRWPKVTPFDFEKKHEDIWILPFKVAIPKYELFACIDDDNGINGYSLQSRGLYNKEITRNTHTITKYKFIPLKIKQIIKRIIYNIN